MIPGSVAALSRPERRARAVVSGGGDFTFAHYSEWAFATGNSVNALRDGDGSGTAHKWNTIAEVAPGGPRPDIIHVVTGGDLPANCPTTNALRLTWRATGETANLRWVVNVPDGSDLWHRFYAYISSGWDGELMNHPHNIDVNELSPTPIQVVMWNISATSGGNYRPGMTFWLNSDSTPRSAQGPVLASQTWYRFEFFREVLSTDPVQIRVYPYVYNLAGTLLADADDYTMAHGGTLAAWYAGGDYINIETVGSNPTALQAARRYIFGNEDPAMAGGSTRYYYFAAVAAALEKIDDRLGP